MKRLARLRKYFLVALIGFSLALSGCEGDDGRNGINGLNGVDGADGQDGSPGDLIGYGALTADDVTPLNLILDLSQSVSYDAATGTLGVHFFLTDEDGNGIDVNRDAYELRIYASELIPAVDPIPLGAVEPGPAWDQLFSERGTPAAGSPLPGTLTLLDADTGEYTYVCANTLGASDNVIRITVRARWRTSEGDVNGDRIVFANPVNASYDFRQAAPGTRLASSGADTATTAGCEKCHGPRIGDVGHGGGYTQVKTCVACHNLNYMASRDLDADLAFMIHRIHDAGTFTDLGDFSEVTYPQPTYICATCHDGPQADLAYAIPTRSNCGSCHEEVDFATGVGHDAGAGQAIQEDDGICHTCHDAADILAQHDPDPEPQNVPEFAVTISMEPPANDSYYVAGETPLITVTLADEVGPVAGTVYTTAQDGEGVANLTEGLSLASLYVYGPRSGAVPVLTTNSTTDPVTPGIQQAHSLFVGGADPQVQTDATGFKYELLAIPADLEPGTYMVRFEGADYGALSDADYWTSSSAFITFQVGTATEEAKLAGDSCRDCHGDTIMHLEGAHPHYSPFDTDPCLGCHDLSGNYAAYIGNRVHAIHSSSATGDRYGSRRDWTEVTYPRPANNCISCHTDTETDTPVWEIAWMPACGGCHGIDPTVVPEDFPEVDPDRIIQEAAAAEHMLASGGVADASEPATLQCLVCHGEGRLADPYETHQLIRFRALPDDPNE